VKKEDMDKIKSEYLVSGDSRRIWLWKWWSQVKRGHILYQTNRYCRLSKELAPYCLEMLD